MPSTDAINDFPVLVAEILIFVAIVGGMAGIAAFVRTNADKTKTVAEAGDIVMKMMERRLVDLEARLHIVENHIVAFEAWADRLIELLDKSMTYIHDDNERVRMEAELKVLKKTRPVRNRRATDKAPEDSV